MHKKTRVYCNYCAIFLLILSCSSYSNLVFAASKDTSDLQRYENFFGITQDMTKDEIAKRFGEAESVDFSLGYLVYTYKRLGLTVKINAETSKVFNVEAGLKSVSMSLFEIYNVAEMYFVGKPRKFILDKLGIPNSDWKGQTLYYIYGILTINFTCFDFWEFYCREVSVSFLKNISKQHLKKYEK